MSKTLVKITAGILSTLLMVTVVSCATKPEPEYADTITEGILQAINENDYAGYTKHFDEVMKNAVPESLFRQTRTAIKEQIGDYISKTFWKVTTQDGYTIVVYKAKFSQEPKDVTVRVVFQEISGEIYVAGLWFDSPKLRGK